MDNDYSIFTTTMQERSKMNSTQGSSDKNEVPKNPRLKILDNFKEISRIMTQSFLMQKNIEKRYGQQTMPLAEKKAKLEGE